MTLERANPLSGLELPRIVRLSSNLFAACFPLMKLIPARFMLDQAERDGRLQANGHIVESTSGTFGLALAMLAAVRHYRLTLISASSLIDDSLCRRLRQLGASVIVTDDPDGSGDQRGRLDRLHSVLADNPGAFWPHQYDSPDNPKAYGRFAEQLIREVGRIDCLVGPTGSGGSMCGTSHFLREAFPHLTAFAVDTHRSVLFGHPAGRRLLRGLGNSIMPANLRHETFDEVHWVGGLPAFAATRSLYRTHALYMGPTSGAAMLVADWYARQNSDAVTVAIMPDEGHRYRDTIYDDAWLESLDGWPSQVQSEPRCLKRIEVADEASWTRLLWRRRTLKGVRASSREAASSADDQETS